MFLAQWVEQLLNNSQQLLTGESLSSTRTMHGKGNQPNRNVEKVRRRTTEHQTVQLK